jgi:antibiotic biosynthesis monooxygenase (ABM) superfamily enzyme
VRDRFFLQTGPGPEKTRSIQISIATRLLPEKIKDYQKLFDHIKARLEPMFPAAEVIITGKARSTENTFMISLDETEDEVKALFHCKEIIDACVDEMK